MAIQATPSFSLKDQLFNPKTVGILADRLYLAEPSFKKLPYKRAVLKRFPELELKARIGWMVETLVSYLPADFLAAIDILKVALPEPLDPTRSDDDFGSYIWVVPGEFAARYGCSAEHLDASLGFLREATKRFSAESAIRPFLAAFPRETMAFVRQCALDKNYHVRRLASEGIRPFLPWAQRVELPIGDLVAVLDHLHADNTRYVTRSVANTLNDISKIDPAAVVGTLKRWQKLDRQDAKELAWMTNHALRTLMKTGNPLALELLGYARKPKFKLADLETTGVVQLGQEFAWRCAFTSLAAQKLKISLRIHFLKANGSHAAKIFSLKNVSVAKNETIQIAKRLAFKPITTRVLYPGTHFADLTINGMASDKRAFDLVV
jgi:3-methyladenine DNA glycosylase AlkC